MNVPLVLQLLVAGAALIVLMLFLDRLRVMSWRTHSWLSVSWHVAWALYLGQIAYSGLIQMTGSSGSVFGVLGAVLWFLVSRPVPTARRSSAYQPTMPCPLDALRDASLIRARHHGETR